MIGNIGTPGTTCRVEHYFLKTTDKGYAIIIALILILFCYFLNWCPAAVSWLRELCCIIRCHCQNLHACVSSKHILIMERKTSYAALKLEEGLGDVTEEESNALLKNDGDDEAQCLQQRCQECKYDGRLFPEYLLYHEGMHKPYLRGVLHFILAFILPFGYYHFYMISNGNQIAVFTSFFYISTNIFCYGMSGLFHTIEWPPQTEIFLQKLDHCGIAILSLGTFVPVAVLLMEYPYGLIFMAMLTSTCIVTCFYILSGQPSVVRQAMVPACLFPFIPYLYGLMSPFEFTCMISCIACQVTGMSIFVNEKPDLFPTVFGYHELFHCFVSGAGMCVYLCNWSVVHRLCQDQPP